MGKKCITKSSIGGKIRMNKLDLIEVSKRIHILNVAYHLCLEITDKRGIEYKAVCPFCRI